MPLTWAKIPDMKKRMLFLVLLIFSLISSIVEGQNIQRRGMMGIAPRPVDSEIASQYDLKEARGVYVAQVFPNTTFTELGGQADDIILEMNNRDINTVIDLRSYLNELRGNDELKMIVWRQGKKLILDGTVIPMPKESSSFSEVIYDEIPFKGGWLRAIINKPKADGKHPTIYFIPGYTCASVENFGPIHPYKKMIDGWSELGYTIVRIEKPGIGDNVNTGDCQQLGFNNELEAYKTGYEFLKKYNFIDQNNIFIFGHSMGGVHAPLIAQEYHPKGVIAYGTIHETWVEYLIKMIRYQNPFFDNNPITTDESSRTAYALLYEHYFLGKSSKELAENPKYKTLLEDHYEFDGTNQILSRHEDYWREINAHNLSAAWINSNSYVLSLYGEADLAAIDEQSHREIARLVNEKHPGAATYQMIPETDHSFIKVGKKEDKVKLYQSPKYRDYLTNQFNYDIISIMDEWMKDKISKRVGS